MTGDGCEVCRGPKAGSHICDKCRDKKTYVVLDGPFKFLFEAPLRKGHHPHMHSTHVEGCFRCDLSRDEALAMQYEGTDDEGEDRD